MKRYLSLGVYSLVAKVGDLPDQLSGGILAGFATNIKLYW